ncbi:MAG: hypothetical protein EOP39_14905 [Rubrivivax sp.]|nr:MAG: hypothetical protein EOP39_14905 [Rubrivivax sp.]
MPTDFFRRFWQRGVLHAGLALFVGPALAQADCDSLLAQCRSTCVVAGRINADIGRSCMKGCDKRQAACANPQAQPEGRGPDDSAPRRGRSGGAPVVAAPAIDIQAMTRPLTPEEIRQLVDASIAADGGYQETMAQIHRLQSIPACNAPPGAGTRPGEMAQKCMEQRQAIRAENRVRSTDNRVLGLRPLLRSMELELDLLPADPVAIIQSVFQLRGKYQPLLGFVPALTTGSPMSEPVREVLTAAAVRQRAFDERRRQAVRQPEVRQAYIEGRLPNGVDLELAPAEIIEWRADAETWQIADPLRRAGGRPLFMDRRKELAASDRETGQAAQWARWGEPSETEMGLALLRVLSLTGGEMRSPFESEASAMAGSGVARIIDVRKQGCRRAGDGYRCDVQLWMQTFNRGWAGEMLLGSGKHPGAVILAGMRQGIRDNNGKTVSHVFRATPNGWVAPLLGSGSSGASGSSGSDVFSTMQEASRRAACSNSGGSGAAAEWSRGLNDCNR